MGIARTKITGLTDTTFNFDITGEDYLEKTKTIWSVSVSDSIFTVQCDEPYSFITPRIIGISDKNQLAYQFKLFQNYPNPFNPGTVIKYSLQNECQVTVKIYNINGREVTTLVSKKQTAGYHQVEWNGTNRSGMVVSNGLYMYKIQAGDFVKTQKMLLLK